MLSELRQRFKPKEEDANPFREDESSRSKSRRPPNTAFRQQRLKSWQPILTPRRVLPLLLLLVVVCTPIGIGFLITSYRIVFLQVDYTQCASEAGTAYSSVPTAYYESHFNTEEHPDAPRWRYDSDGGSCQLQFYWPDSLRGPVYLYYKLTNFYQNHRMYVSSYDWNQLHGQAVSRAAISSDCGNMKTRADKIVYPCGLVANSLFNDTFSNLTEVGGSRTYGFSDKGIAWESDLARYGRTQYSVDDIVPPQNWAEAYPNGYTEGDLDSLATNERFMNWMRTAALPSFYKLYGINRHDTLHGDTTYSLSIGMHFPVSNFGTKSVVLTSSSLIGGRDFGLGICYLVVGAMSLFFMIAFVVRHGLTRKRLNHTYLEELGTDASSMVSGQKSSGSRVASGVHRRSML